MEDEFKNVTLIPGWMGKVAGYEKYKGIEVWKGKDFPKEDAQTTWIVTHSLGAHYAMQRWEKDESKKFILVNPLLPHRKIFSQIITWLKFFITEGPDIPKKISFFNFPFALKKFFLLNQVHLEDILKNISKERVVIVRGKKDAFLCGEVCARIIGECGIKLIEAEEAGHNWHEKFDEIIKETSNS